ncbi:hypothetical protein LSAT2_016135 [Lamellibrachia satsuma]|nr:hypothetical protein LSAT2_016135 [Lamellibrachia satsuma]
MDVLGKFARDISFFCTQVLEFLNLLEEVAMLSFQLLLEQVEVELQEQVEVELQEQVEVELQEQVEVELQERVEVELQERVEVELQEQVEVELQEQVEVELQERVEVELQEQVEVELQGTGGSLFIFDCHWFAELKEVFKMKGRYIVQRAKFPDIVGKMNKAMNTVDQHVSSIEFPKVMYKQYQQIMSIVTV